MRKVPYNTAVVQLVEQRPPKPKVVGSSPACCEYVTVAHRLRAQDLVPEAAGSSPVCHNKKF